LSLAIQYYLERRNQPSFHSGTNPSLHLGVKMFTRRTKVFWACIHVSLAGVVAFIVTRPTTSVPTSTSSPSFQRAQRRDHGPRRARSPFPWDEMCSNRPQQHLPSHVRVRFRRDRKEGQALSPDRQGQSRRKGSQILCLCRIQVDFDPQRIQREIPRAFFPEACRQHLLSERTLLDRKYMERRASLSADKARTIVRQLH
jgi:hypothetical protein